MNLKGRTRQVIKRLRAKGMPVREIAEVLELTTQAVYYHLRAEKGAGHGDKASRPRS